MIKIKAGFVVLLTSGIYFGSVYLMLLFVAAAVLHELGHIAAARMCGLSIQSLTLSAQGAELKLCRETESFAQDLFICLSGPGINLLCAAVCLALGKYPAFLGTSLLLGLFNLLPVLPLDGGNGLFALLSLGVSWRCAERIARSVSMLTAFVACVVGFVLCCLNGGKPYLLLLGLWLMGCCRGK